MVYWPIIDVYGDGSKFISIYDYLGLHKIVGVNWIQTKILVQLPMVSSVVSFGLFSLFATGYIKNSPITVTPVEVSVKSWSTTRVKEFNKLNFKLNFQLKDYKNQLVFIVVIYAKIYRENLD